MNAWVYILKCADGSFYVGSHRGGQIETRVNEHNAGFGGDYTRRRLPVTLVWCESFEMITDAIAAERQIKGWGRAKKQALIDGDWKRLSDFARRRGGRSKA